MSILALSMIVIGLFATHLFRIEPLAVAAQETPGATARLDLETGAVTLPGAADPDLASQWAYAPPRVAACAEPAAAGGRTMMGYLPAHDPAAQASLTGHCGALGTVLAETWRLEDWQGTVTLVADAPTPELVDRTMPVLTLGRWLEPELAEARLSDSAFLSSLALRLELMSDTTGAGMCLDLSTRPELSGATVEAAVIALAGPGTRCLIGSAEAVFWDRPSLIESLDLAVVQGFRPPGGPGQPPAPAAWFTAATDRVTTLIPVEKLVIALGTRGFAWQSGAAGLRELGYADAMAAASDAGAEVGFVPWANAARTRILAQDSGLTEIWLPDAVAVQNQLAGLAPDQRIAVWPLGSEDPSIWPLLSGAAPVRDTLEAPIEIGVAVRIHGEGPAILGAASPALGQRAVTVDEATGLVTEATYTAVPAPATILRGGQPSADGVSLSFSSLPPAEHWPALEAILAAEDIEATFLLETADLLGNPDIARRAVAAGHVVGLRQPERPADAGGAQQIGDRFRQVVVQDRTGFGARLVEAGRPGDWSSIAAAAGPLIEAGYVPLVPVDYDRDRMLAALRSDPAIRSMPRADTGLPDNRVAFTVGRSDWEAVVRDLPSMLPVLAGQGYHFRPLTEAAGVSETAAMPALPEAPSQGAVTAVLSVLAFANGGLNTVFYWFLIYSAIRSIVYLVLAIARRPKRDFDPNWTPPVSVLIPAFNEAKVIEKCVRSILEAEYTNLTVVVIDDGSTDDTFGVVQRAFGDDPRVVLLRQPNGGKWAAANHGLEEVDTPFFLVADADSIFTPDTIGWLVQQFRDDSVGAVAGLVEVGNRGSFLGSCQALEYLVSQSVMRRAQEVFDGILVVPGAVGAWRTEAVRAAALFSGQTVTEDADLTVAVHRAGYRVVFQEQARSVTEAPSSVRDFMRQRLRWTFGMLQTSWKHAGAIRERRTVGYISIIDAIWFGVVSAIFAPLVDLLLLLLVVQGAWALATGGTAVLASIPVGLFVAYFALTLLDVANTLVSFRFERRFDWKLLALVPLLRFGYRQLLYISTIRALGQALTGTAAHWNKLDRSGAVLSLWSPLAKPTKSIKPVKPRPWQPVGTGVRPAE